MRYKASHCMRLVGVLALSVVLAGSIGCKKKLPKEVPPPPTKEVNKPVAESDTTGQAERELRQQLESDLSRIQVIYFDFDNSSIRVDQKARISANAEILRKWPATQITVEGYCDERGTTEYNLALGEHRANSAKKALVAAGVEASRIISISFGEERAADTSHNEAAWSKNRRAEFVIK